MSDILDRLAEVIERRKGGDPQRSYVARLLARGEDAVLKKIGEEAAETVMAAKEGDRLRIVARRPTSGFIAWSRWPATASSRRDVLAELRRREGISGIDEKAGAVAARPRRSDSNGSRQRRRRTASSARSSRGEIPSQKGVRRRRGPRASTTSARSPRCTSCSSRNCTSPRSYDAELAHAPLLGRLLALAGRIAREQGATDGFRTIVNTGRVGSAGGVSSSYPRDRRPRRRSGR